MSDFLNDLSQRIFGDQAEVRPRPASRFEAPQLGPALSEPERLTPLDIEPFSALDSGAIDPLPSRARTPSPVNDREMPPAVTAPTDQPVMAHPSVGLASERHVEAAHQDAHVDSNPARAPLQPATSRSEPAPAVATRIMPAPGVEPTGGSSSVLVPSPGPVPDPALPVTPGVMEPVPDLELRAQRSVSSVKPIASAPHENNEPRPSAPVDDSPQIVQHDVVSIPRRPDTAEIAHDMLARDMLARELARLTPRLVPSTPKAESHGAGQSPVPSGIEPPRPGQPLERSGVATSDDDRKPVNGEGVSLAPPAPHVESHDDDRPPAARTAETTPSAQPAVVARVAPVVDRTHIVPKIQPATMATDRLTPALPPPPTINVTIGRIEVRAALPQPASSRPAARSSVMSLEDYMRRRADDGHSNGGRR